MTDNTARTPERIAQPGAYSAPTGETVEIPANSTIIRNGDLVQTQVGKVLIDVPDAQDAEIVFWHNPPQTPEGQLHESQVEGYEPHFDRTASTRRVLMHITDETDNFELGPRNTLTSIADALLRDPYTPQFDQRMLSGEDAEAGLMRHLERLIGAGLVVQRDDNTFEITDAGRTELAN